MKTFELMEMEWIHDALSIALPLDLHLALLPEYLVLSSVPSCCPRLLGTTGELLCGAYPFVESVFVQGIFAPPRCTRPQGAAY